MTKSPIKFLVASLSGNVLEWYDFAIYGYFAHVLTKVFFPSINGFMSTVAIFGIFASGFLIRPFGSMLFGYIGDTRGRKTALLASVTLITISTTMMGVLPSFHQAGILSPILLTFFRLLQGLAVSGELTGSGIFIMESCPPRNRNLFSSLVMSSTYVGLLTGAGVVALLTFIFSAEKIQSFAWRVPFLCSALFGAITLVLRIKCTESPMFIEAVKKNALLRNPVSQCFKEHSLRILFVCLCSASLAVAIYLIIGYMPTFLADTKGMGLRECMSVSLTGLLLLTILAPCAGYLSNKASKIKILATGSCGLILFSFPIFKLANQPGLVSPIISECLLAIFLAPIAGTIISILSEAFPLPVRYTAVSMGYSFSMTLFGGTTPLIALCLTKMLGSNLAPAYYLAFSGILSLVGVFGLQHMHASLGKHTKE